MADENVITIGDRIPKLKEQRRHKANRRLIIYLSIFFFLILLIIYFQSPLSHIKSVEVSGNYFVTDEQIIETSGLQVGTSIWNIDRKQVATQIVSIEEVEEAVVSRKLPNTIIISVDEYSRVAYLMEDGDYFPILETGLFLDEMAQEYLPFDAPVLVNWKQGEEVSELATELSKLPVSVINRISEIHHSPTKSDPLQILMYMNDGFQVRSTIRKLAEKMNAYPSIIEELDPEIKGTIHLRMTPYFEPYEREIEGEIDREG